MTGLILTPATIIVPELLKIARAVTPQPIEGLEMVVCAGKSLQTAECAALNSELDFCYHRIEVLEQVRDTEVAA